jgi:deazaflavin-dependent oxidoreductase (nitroreductase family)
MSSGRTRPPGLSDHALARFTMALPDPAVRMTGKLNALVYRLSHGRVAGRFAHEPILILTTTGRRTRERRSTVVLYHAEGERLVVVGSNTGSDRPPAWALNLIANPEAELQIGGERFKGTSPRRRRRRADRTVGRDERSLCQL